jgi:hypothetical protein
MPEALVANGLCSVFQAGLANGGPAGLIYGFLFTWLGTIFQTLVMAEMASMLVGTLRDFGYILTCCLGFLYQEASTIGKHSIFFTSNLALLTHLPGLLFSLLLRAPSSLAI